MRAIKALLYTGAGLSVLLSGFLWIERGGLKFYGIFIILLVGYFLMFALDLYDDPDPQ